MQAVLDESAKVLRYRHNVLIVEHKLGFVHANAGIDRSNITKQPIKFYYFQKIQMQVPLKLEISYQKIEKIFL